MRNSAVGIRSLSTSNHYIGAAGDLPGAATFTASVLFKGTCPGTGGTRRSLFGNCSAALATGWNIFLDPDGVIGCSIAETGPAVETVDTVYNFGPSQLMLVTMVVAAADTSLRMFVCGQQCDDQETDIAAPLPSALAPLIGASHFGALDALAEGATDVHILGAMYDGVTAWTAAQNYQHWLACQAAGRMVDAGFGAGGYTMPTATNLWDAYTNNGGRGVPNPSVALATWDDLYDLVNLTRVGSPTVQGFAI